MDALTVLVLADAWYPAPWPRLTALRAGTDDRADRPLPRTPAAARLAPARPLHQRMVRDGFFEEDGALPGAGRDARGAVAPARAADRRAGLARGAANPPAPRRTTRRSSSRSPWRRIPRCSSSRARSLNSAPSGPRRRSITSARSPPAASRASVGSSPLTDDWTRIRAPRGQEVVGGLVAEAIEVEPPVRAPLPRTRTAARAWCFRRARQVGRVRHDHVEALAANRREEIAAQGAHAHAVQPSVQPRAGHRSPGDVHRRDARGSASPSCHRQHAAAGEHVEDGGAAPKLAGQRRRQQPRVAAGAKHAGHRDQSHSTPPILSRRRANR